MLAQIALTLVSLLRYSFALRYDPAHVGYNLNENQTATEPKYYWGQWQNHTFNPSPANWRFPIYTLTIDRYVDGDPTNNEANGTVFEHFWMTNQFRFGGDVAGVLSDLDYIQGMGAKGIYFTGSMMINTPWSPDGYGPLDFTLLDGHHGDIDQWRALIDEIHSRGMYVIFDNTMATMGNLLGYGGNNLNSTVEFSFDEYDFIWKYPERHYLDFEPGNARDPSCQPPTIYEQNGYPETQDILSQFHGCRDSEFDMYGDIKGVGAYPSYVNQLSRFASVQDRLREWRPDVLEKIKVMSCMQIAMLDIDGFRMDKAVQTTIDALAEFSDYQRQCAKRVGKENFLVIGELVADPDLAAIYFGRGKQPNQALTDSSVAVTTSNTTDPGSYLRPFGMTALDGAAFHYDIYGSMTRFLGLSSPWGKLGVDFVKIWNTLLSTHDLVNANTGVFDPRHTYGMTDQDVFRWPALVNGTQRQLLGFFVTVLELPGIPLFLFGEEQEHYVLENLAPDYVFGRTPMASSRAWQLHGCYGLGEEVYVDMPFGKSGEGCHDDSVSLDHRDPSHPIRNLLKRMMELRDQYPVLNDGFNLTTLSTRTYNIYMAGSENIPSEIGLWSVYRGRSVNVQDFTGIANGNQPVWLLFHNENQTVTYTFDCDSQDQFSSDGAIVSAFPQGTNIKNLFYPYEEYQLDGSKFTYGLENSTEANGCIPQISFRPWEFKAFVPTDKWQQPKPVITQVKPGHDARLESTVSYNQTESVTIQISFSMAMDCDSVTNTLQIESTTQLGVTATLDKSSVTCSPVSDDTQIFVGYAPAAWLFTAKLDNVANGVHTYTVNNATAQNGTLSINARDKFMFRIGQTDNPMVFPISANYTQGLLNKDPNTGSLIITPRAAGADKVRYSTNWGSSFSEWQSYTGESIAVQKQAWSGTKDQEWDGEHVIVHYWSRMTGSSDHVQHADLDRDNQPPRRWPHAWVQGDWNQWGYDGGLDNQMSQDSVGNWVFDLFTEWPANVSVSVWGMNPDGNPDKSATYGDVDQDGVLDWLPPDSLASNVVNISATPTGGHFGFRLVVNDGNFNYSLVPYGSIYIQLIVMILLCVVPPVTAFVGVRTFMAAFYKVKFNKFGVGDKRGMFSKIPDIPSLIRDRLPSPAPRQDPAEPRDSLTLPGVAISSDNVITGAVAADAGSPARRTVLVATVEYEIEDWAIKIKIGGLGVMASLMAKNLGHQNLIWVVPCAGDVNYPFEEETTAEPMQVGILGQTYSVDVHYHILRNITFVILDAPIFRKRTKAEPYAPRMDDLESAVYYSAWNQCIAEAIRRFKPELYHINDYHGALAPLYLLPSVIPCCLSLHNAEFQGMWPLRTSEQLEEMSRVYNLKTEIIEKYVQFGNVFNLLHAGARYLWTHQAGYGAVGVSSKYGKRVLERYPIFWSLKNIGSLPNPDPTDTAPWDGDTKPEDAQVDPVQEQQKLISRRQTQEWAGLNVDPKAELFIFVGRWSYQKGIDLIADVFPSLIQSNPKVQLICVGPVIDLYGKFAALKLEKLMGQYPGRVFSKPEFTALPPFIFNGAEFALMPSRDEPFGLVAVEFGRKGALCVGSRVGGFGHMPGWWFTVESITPKHLINQFKAAISAALSSDQETRALMRAYSLVQRFPVAKWVKDLDQLQSSSIHMSMEVRCRQHSWRNISVASSLHRIGMRSTSSLAADSPQGSPPDTPVTPSPLNRSTGSRVNSLLNQSMSPTPSVFQGFRPFEPSRLGPGRQLGVPDASEPSTPHLSMDLPRSSVFAFPLHSPAETPSRRVSLETISNENNDVSLQQNLTPIFNDSKNKYYDRFSEKLDKLYAKTSKKNTYIEDYIQHSEKDWFQKYHYASLRQQGPTENEDGEPRRDNPWEEYNEYLGDQYQAPSGAKMLLLRKVGPWFVHWYLLALGQLLSASSLQITLLTGEVGQPAPKLYTLCSIYIVTCLGWWICYRRLPSVYVLSLPFIFYGLGFCVLGMSILAKSPFSKGWVYNVAAGLYTVGSSAGSFYFSLNFGTEGGSTSRTWAFRSCVITGTQQLLISFLLYWGAPTRSANGGMTSSPPPSAAVVAGVAFPLAVLMCSIGALLFLGLPSYYRQKPGAVPSMYRSLCRRSIVIWFWIMVILQTYWLSTTFNRNWMFLWSSQHAPSWAVALLVLLFFVFVWAATLTILSRLSKQHAWIIPITAIGLGAPHWCQMLWGISGMGGYIPWAGPVGGALLGRSVWLWLGVLGALQDVGFGMILLTTLTRVHLTFVLPVAQMIGALVTIIARLSAPNKVGPSTVFPNFAVVSVATPWLWVALGCQLIICFGYFKSFRKAQLQKP